MYRLAIILLSLFAMTAYATFDSYEDLTVAELFALIPECSIDCKMDTLITDGCLLDDFQCHCSKWEYIQENTQPCLLSKSSCRLTELYEFVDIMTNICTYFKIKPTLEPSPRSRTTITRTVLPAAATSTRTPTMRTVTATFKESGIVTPAGYVSLETLEDEL